MIKKEARVCFVLSHFGFEFYISDEIE